MAWRVAISIHATLAGSVLAWSVWGAYTFWAGVFGSPLAAVGAIALIEAVALAGYALHILGSDSPVAWARHVLPLASVAPATKSLHDLAAQQVGDGWAWALAGLLAGALALAAWAVWSGLERLLINRDQRQRQQREQAIARMRAEALHALALISLMRQTLADIDAERRPALLAARELPLPAAQAVVPCARCGAEVPVPAGKLPAAVRAATGRYGCAACREGGSNDVGA